MADKKTITKKTSAKTEKTLVEQLADVRKDLLDAKKSHAAGELVNPRAITGYKKDVARILTNINANNQSEEEEK